MVPQEMVLHNKKNQIKDSRVSCRCYLWLRDGARDGLVYEWCLLELPLLAVLLYHLRQLSSTGLLGFTASHMLQLVSDHSRVLKSGRKISRHHTN